MIVRDHEPSPQGPFCRWCGAKSLNGTFGSEATCTPREVINDSSLRPEPARRQFASEAFDDISRRIGELYQARTEAMNHVEPEPAQAPQPDFDYGCG